MAALPGDDNPTPPKSPTRAPAPTINSLHDLSIIEAWDPDKNQAKYCTFYYLTRDEELYFGESQKNKRELSLDDFASLLQHVPDHEVFPEAPDDVELTAIPPESDTFNDSNAFLKRPGLNCYETMRELDWVPRSVLEETLMMERISKTPHPYIIKYHGCRVRRGRITCLVLELLDLTLTQFAKTPEFQRLDKARFLDGVDSAVKYLHSLGLAHNDINPDNIMVGKDLMPVLIDFGSCAPFGGRLQSLGSPGWYEELFYTSEKKHDLYSLRKLEEWLARGPEEPN